MASRRVALRVVEEHGCSTFKIGDQMVLDLPSIDMASSPKTCVLAIHAFVSKHFDAICAGEGIEEGSSFSCSCDQTRFEVDLLPERLKPRPPDQALIQDIAAAVTYLRSVPIFAPLPAGFLARLAHRIRMEHFKPGEVVLQKGAPGRALYVVRSGQLDVCDFADRHVAHVLTRMRERDCFGEMSILTNTPTAATVIAKDEVTLYAVDKGDFEVLLRENPFMAASFTRLMASRLVAANFRIIKEGSRSFGGRLSVMSLTTVLQVLADSRRSGTLEVKNDDGDFGEIGFREGQIYQARCGGVGGVDAIYQMLGWNTGSFSLNPKQVPKEDLIRTGVMNILLEGMRLLDEAGIKRAATEDIAP